MVTISVLRPHADWDHCEDIFSSATTLPMYKGPDNTHKSCDKTLCCTICDFWTWKLWPTQKKCPTWRLKYSNGCNLGLRTKNSRVNVEGTYSILTQEFWVLRPELLKTLPFVSTFVRHMSSRHVRAVWFYLYLLQYLSIFLLQLLLKPKFSSIEKIKTIGSTYMLASGLRPGLEDQPGVSRSIPPLF